MVHKASNSIGERFALKRCTHIDGKDRFIRELELLLRVSREAPELNGIVRVRGHGYHNDLPYFVTDVAYGGNLRRWLGDHPGTSLAELVACLGPAVAAIHWLNERYICHRDVKLENILCFETGWVVSDLGIARVPGSEFTGDECVVGTPGCMPPEQSLGLSYPNFTDQYALALLVCSSIGVDPHDSGSWPLHQATREVLAKALMPKCKDRHRTIEIFYNELANSAPRLLSQTICRPKPVAAVNPACGLVNDSPTLVINSHLDSNSVFFQELNRELVGAGLDDKARNLRTEWPQLFER